MYSNELKYFVISDRTQQYDKINRNILKIAKIFFNVIKNYSSELLLIDTKFNLLGDIKIKQLLENQNKIIKDLVKIINDILLEKINNEVVRKYEGQSLDTLEEPDKPLYQKGIITNKNLNLIHKPNYNIVKSYNNKNNKKEVKYKNNNNYNYNYNKKRTKHSTKSLDENLISKKILNQKEIIPLNVIFPKSNNEFSGTLSFFNLNSNKYTTNFKPYDKYSNKSYDLNQSFKPNKNFETIIRQEPKDKKYPYYNNNNYTIDEEKYDNYSGINERQTSITSNNNFDEEYGNMPQMMNSKKKKIKYRTIKDSSSEKSLNKNRSMSNLKTIPTKSDYFMNSFPTFTINSNTDKNDDISYKKRCHTTFNFFKPNLFNFKDKNILKKVTKTKLYSEPYINNGIIYSPSNYTKNFLNASYNKINNYYNRNRYTTLYE